MTINSTIPTQVLADLRDIVGNARVMTDPPQLAYYATDISGEADTRPGVIVKPESVDNLARTVALLTRADIAVIARGAGFSYTSGYLATQSPSAIIDTTDLNRIVEINETDRYVTVESGCTWATLYDALKA